MPALPPSRRREPCPARPPIDEGRDPRCGRHARRCRRVGSSRAVPWLGRDCRAVAAAWAAGATSPAARAYPASPARERREDHPVDVPSVPAAGCRSFPAGCRPGPGRHGGSPRRPLVDGGKAHRHLGADARGRGGQGPAAGVAGDDGLAAPACAGRQDAAGGQAGGARRARRCHGGGRSRPPGPGTGHAGQTPPPPARRRRATTCAFVSTSCGANTNPEPSPARQVARGPLDHDDAVPGVGQAQRVHHSPDRAAAWPMRPRRQAPRRPARRARGRASARSRRTRRAQGSGMADATKNLHE